MRCCGSPETCFISDSSSVKSKTARFSAIRCGLDDFGITILPSCTCRRNINLRRAAALIRRDPADKRIAEQAPPLAERSPGLRQNPVLGVELSRLSW